MKKRVMALIFLMMIAFACALSYAEESQVIETGFVALLDEYKVSEWQEDSDNWALLATAACCDFGFAGIDPDFEVVNAFSSTVYVGFDKDGGAFLVLFTDGKDGSYYLTCEPGFIRGVYGKAAGVSPEMYVEFVLPELEWHQVSFLESAAAMNTLGEMLIDE